MSQRLQPLIYHGQRRCDWPGTAISTKLSAEQMVDSILRPSKLIDKQYAQVSVLTDDGLVQTGVRISESKKEIVLRNLAQLEPITIDQEDIEEIMESKVSLMPENLTRQLKSRKEFDDLLKYIIETRKR